MPVYIHANVPYVPWSHVTCYESALRQEAAAAAMFVSCRDGKKGVKGKSLVPTSTRPVFVYWAFNLAHSMGQSTWFSGYICVLLVLLNTIGLNHHCRRRNRNAAHDT